MSLTEKNGGRLLVVDDNEMNRDMLSRRLQRKGYSVESVDGGKKALEAVDNEVFDLVLLDIMMPDIDGMEVLTRLRKTYSQTDLPIIMATAKEESSDIVAALELGANDYVSKPLDFPVVLARVENALERKRVAEALKTANKKLQEKEEEQRCLTAQLSKYLSPQIYESIFSGDRVARIETRRRKLSVFFSDMVGFTERTDSMEPEDLSSHLNDYLNRMAEVVLDNGGTLDKFVGDAVMVFFGDPESEGPQEDAIKCVRMAMEMYEVIEDLKREWKSKGFRSDFSVRMGIASGFCTVGNFGSDRRMEYTIIGSPVNLASRLESASKPGDVLISQETAEMVDRDILTEEVESITAKGFARPVKAYRVIGYRKTKESKTVLNYADPGFELNLDLDKVTDEGQQELIQKLQQAVWLVKNQNQD